MYTKTIDICIFLCLVHCTHRSHPFLCTDKVETKIHLGGSVIQKQSAPRLIHVHSDTTDVKIFLDEICHADNGWQLLLFCALIIDSKFGYPNNPDGWWLSGMWGKHVCVVGIQLQGRKCKNLHRICTISQQCQTLNANNFLQKTAGHLLFLNPLVFSCSVQSKYNGYQKKMTCKCRYISRKFVFRLDLSSPVDRAWKNKWIKKKQV